MVELNLFCSVFITNYEPLITSECNVLLSILKCSLSVLLAYTFHFLEILKYHPLVVHVCFQNRSYANVFFFSVAEDGGVLWEFDK